REPMQWGQLAGAAHLWVQNVGAVAALGLALWMLAYMLQRRRLFVHLLADLPRPVARPLAMLLSTMAWLSFVGYLLGGLIALGGIYGAPVANWLPRAGRTPTLSRGDYLLSASGLLALLVILTPLSFGLVRLRPRRIAALARLSVKEAIRSRVVLVF